MSRILFILISLPVFTAIGQAQTNQNTPSVSAFITQFKDTIWISDTTRVIPLKCAPFAVHFKAAYTNMVFLNCSFDSIAYKQISVNQKDSLTCFRSSQTFSEPRMNYTHDIIITREVDDGYHCLFGKNDNPEFIRFDNVNQIDTNTWIGTRTVEMVYIVPRKGITELKELNGKKVYFIYSPGLEHDGKAFVVSFTN